MEANKRKQKKKGRWQQYIGIACFAVMGAGCGIAMMRYLDRSGTFDLPWGELLLALCVQLLLFIAVFYVQIILHEGGHLVFGLLSGYRFVSFRIGGWMWIRQNGQIRLSKMFLAGTGGQCLMDPPELNDGKMPYRLYNLGGSLMNMMTAAICAGAAILWESGSWLTGFLVYMAVVGIGYGLMNGIPLRLGAVNNDGYNAKDMGKSTASLRAFWIQMRMNAMQSENIRLRDMPEEWFAMPTDEELQNSMVAVLAVLRANRLLDMHQFDQTEQLIDRLLAAETAVVSVHRYLLTCDRVYCELLRGGDNRVVRRLREKDQMKFMKQMKDYPSVIRTEYAYALLWEKDSEKAEQIREQFERRTKTYPYAAEIEGERELMDLCDRKKED